MVKFLTDKEFWAKQARDFGAITIFCAALMWGGWQLSQQAMALVERFVDRAIAQMDAQQQQYVRLETKVGDNTDLVKANIEATGRLLSAHEQSLTLQRETNETLKRIESNQ